jgi:DivIVA domain-containing protein
MPDLTPADVRNAVFKKPPLGKRGYDEEQVDAFLDDVERTLAALTAEVESLRAQLGGHVQPAPPPNGADASVLAELQQINHRLARIEATAFSAPRRSSGGDALFGGG